DPLGSISVRSDRRRSHCRSRRAWSPPSMIVADRVAAVLLAAGQSTRFGAADKLHADLGGRPLVTHVAATLRQLGFGALIAVCGPTTAPMLDGFDIVRNDAP